MNEIELEFTQLVREFKKTVYSVCYFFSKDPSKVDDLFQEVLINLWNGNRVMFLKSRRRN